MKMVSVGYKHYVNADRVIAVSSLLGRNASLVKIRQKKSQEGKLVSLQSGRKARSMLFMDCGAVVLSALSSETIKERLQLAQTSSETKEDTPSPSPSIKAKEHVWISQVS